jgi:hypothetical protein
MGVLARAGSDSGSSRIPWSSPAGIDEENGAEIGELTINQDPSVGSVDGKLFDFVGFMGLGKS